MVALVRFVAPGFRLSKVTVPSTIQPLDNRNVFVCAAQLAIEGLESHGTEKASRETFQDFPATKSSEDHGVPRSAGGRARRLEICKPPGRSGDQTPQNKGEGGAQPCHGQLRA